MSKLKVIGLAVLVVVLGFVAGLVGWGVMSSRKPGAGLQQLQQLAWWQHAVLYQVYPRSFKDSDADGVGDLQGIISELEHFVEAGVDAIWMSPIFASPMVDFGYDISDFYAIHEEYGTMQDFEQLMDKAHSLGIKVLLDFVPNHASTESEYFIKSEAGDPDYKDFFIWADPLPDPQNESNILPPSNWVSLFGGSAWQWSESRKQFYLHQFAIQQADFNYRNDRVKEEMFNILKFWFDKGVDGFRIDAVPHLIEAEAHEGKYPDEPLSGLTKFGPNDLGYTIPIYTKDQIELYPIVYSWRNFADDYQKKNGGDTRVLFVEAYANISMTMLYYGEGDKMNGAHFPFNFDFITSLSAKSNARDFVYTILKWLTYVPYRGTPNWVFGNHDNNRMASRFRPDMVDGLNSLSMILPGVAVSYQGEEIGMRDGYVSWEDTVDIEACNRGSKDTYQQYSRDPARTPYQWNNSTNAGFSASESTWLPVAQDYIEINLAKQKTDRKSHFKVYQALTKLRKEKTLSHGDYDIQALSDQTFYVIRSLQTYDSLVLLFNVSEESDTVDLTRIHNLKLPCTVNVASIHSTRNSRSKIVDYKLTLIAGEALILRAPPI